MFKTRKSTLPDIQTAFTQGLPPGQLIPALKAQLLQIGEDREAIEALRKQVPSMLADIDDIKVAVEQSRVMKSYRNLFGGVHSYLCRAIGQELIDKKELCSRSHGGTGSVISLKELGLNKNQSARYQVLASMSPEQFQAALKHFDDDDEAVPTPSGIVRLYKSGQLTTSAESRQVESTEALELIETTATVNVVPDESRAAANLKRAISKFLEAASDIETAPYKTLKKTLESARIERALERATSKPKTKKSRQSKTDKSSSKPGRPPSSESSSATAS